MTTSPDVSRQLLRHILATLAYRGGKAVRDAPESFGSFSLGPGSRTAGQVLAHMNDLMDWAVSIARGKQAWRDTQPAPWPDEVARFFAGLQQLDECLASDTPLACTAERLFQAPLADAFTHVGQIAMMRRLAESPVRGENYYQADIAAGRVGAAQSAPRREF